MYIKSWLSSLIALTLVCCQLAIAEDTIMIGVAPHSSSRVILEAHATLRSFLENHFHRPVQISTAPTFTEFTRRSLQGKYDLLITSPHLALLAAESAHYQPLLTYHEGLETLLLSKTNTCPSAPPVSVLGLDPISFVTLTGLKELADRGLTTKTGLSIEYASASDSTALAVSQGKADIAIVSKPNYNKLPESTRQQLQICWTSTPKPSRIYLVKPNAQISLEQWQAALKAFIQSPEGEAHLKSNKFTAFREVNETELKSVQDLADMARQILNESTP